MTPAEELASIKKSLPLQCRPVPKDRPKVFRCKLKEIRTGLGLTLDEVANRIGIHSTALSVIERGTNIYLTTALKLSRFFQMPIERIWEEIDEE